MSSDNTKILICPRCGAKNRVPLEKAGMKARCGQCGSSLKSENGAGTSPKADTFVFRCPACGARNKIPGDRLDSGPTCGKCGQPLHTAELFEPQPLRITDQNFQQKILKSPLPALVFAWAPWCPTCRAFLPVIDDYARTVTGRVRVGKLNVDENPSLSSAYNILSVPRIFIFDRGQLRETLPGSMQKPEIQKKMAVYLL